jgi:hypothetical protein
MNKKLWLLILVGAAVGFFLRSTISQWPVFSNVYNMTGPTS